MLTLLALIETQGSEHWVLIERKYSRPEELRLLKVAATQQDESEAGLADILADGRLSKVDVLVDKFKVEVATEEMVGARRANTQQKGRMIASPEDFESVWKEGPSVGEGPGGCTQAEKLLESSQFRASTGEATIRKLCVSGGQLEGQMELRKPLEEFQTCGRTTIPGARPAEADVPSPASDKGGLKSFLLDPAHVEATADSSDETDTSLAERSFYLNYGEKDFEDQILPPPLEKREEHLEAPPGGETRPELSEELAVSAELSSLDLGGSAAASSRNKDEGSEAHTASLEEGMGPRRNRQRPNDLEIFFEHFSKRPSTGQTFSEDWEEAGRGVEGEFTHPASMIAATEEEGTSSGDLMGQAEKSPLAGWKNHSPHRAGSVHPDLPPCALPWKPAKPDRGNFLPKDRGLHTQTGEPATEDSKVQMAFLQMEVINPLPTSSGPFQAQAPPEEASPSPAPRGLGEPLQLREPFGEESPMFLKHTHPPKESPEPKDRVEPVATLDRGERRAPPVTSRKPRVVLEEIEGAVPLRLGFPAGKQKEMTPFQTGGQEGSLEDISKTSVANKIRIFETHGAETRRVSHGETRLLPSELSSEASLGQVEQQRTQLLDLGFVQLQPPGDIASPKAAHFSVMPPATRYFREGTSATSHHEGCMEPELISPDSGCETTLEEATGGTGHVSPCPDAAPSRGS